MDVARALGGKAGMSNWEIILLASQGIILFLLTSIAYSLSVIHSQLKRIADRSLEKPE